VSEGTKRLALLGSTGSIGCQTLDVVAWHPERFEVVALAARSDSPEFRAQVERHKPALAVVQRAGSNDWAPDGTRLLVGPQALVEAAAAPDVDLVVVATTVIISLEPTIAAL
jgi:1-deoxy-D-xylulose-5-phosphate reductoisomerase